MKNPPLLLNFQNADQFVLALGERQDTPTAGEIYTLVSRGLPPCVSIEAVAVLFGFSPSFVSALTRATRRYYRSFEIRSGKKIRRIESPRIPLKLVQKWLSVHLSSSVQFPEHVCGFVSGKSVVDSAYRHCNAHWVYSCDIRNFFGSVSADLVVAALEHLGYSRSSSTLISKFCMRRGALPQGSPASPVLSNLVMGSIDAELEKYAAKNGFRLSRYADDITLSGQGDHPAAEEVRNVISEIVATLGFELSSEKEQMSTGNQRLRVHGLLVNGSKPRLTKGYRNRIRAYRHLISKDRIVGKDANNIVMGHLAFAKMVDSGKMRGQELS